MRLRKHKRATGKVRKPARRMHPEIPAQTSEWETPADLFNALDSEFHFTLDAAATPVNSKCDKFYTWEDSAFDHSWAGETVFVNPPYGERLQDWVWKAHEEKDCTVVMLLPSRTDNGWFHLLLESGYSIRFLKRRVKFWYRGKPVQGSPMFPSLIAVFHSSLDADRTITSWDYDKEGDNGEGQDAAEGSDGGFCGTT